MQVRIRELATAEIQCRTRLPFRFGGVTVTDAPLLHLQVGIEDQGGQTTVGMASDLLMPKWFRKDVDRSTAGDQEALRTSVRKAVLSYQGQESGTVFALWDQVQRELVENEPPTTPDLLERGFGIALVERALIDAVCRLMGVAFADAVPSDLLGRGFRPPRPALRKIDVRHTVGRLDPLRTAEIASNERLDDAMPQALDSVLKAHGVRWLKVKIGGGLASDVERLTAIGELLDELRLAHVRVTLDGNEQLADFAALTEVWRATNENPHGKSLLQRVQWVEQPLPRAHSGAGDTESWPFGPLVLDEADVQRRTWHDSGYDGVSVKNCKGVFRALLHAEWAAKHPGRFQSAEDLTNLPALAVQQDLCTAAVLGLEHTERNGHHFFPGLDHLPLPVIRAVLARHGDLYERSDHGAKLRIEDGSLSIGSLHGPGYGCHAEVIEALGRELDWTEI